MAGLEDFQEGENHARSYLDVSLYHLALLLLEWSWLPENRVGHRYLADVVQEGASPHNGALLGDVHLLGHFGGKLSHDLGVITRVAVAGLERSKQCTQPG